MGDRKVESDGGTLLTETNCLILLFKFKFDIRFNKMGAAQVASQYMTFKEFLAFEEEQEDKDKYEYLNGELLAMARPSSAHNKIIFSLGAALDRAIEATGKNCFVMGSEIKVYIEKANHGVYPDVMMICGEEELYEEENSVITNPTLIIEVLSKSTAAYDRGLKFEKYRSLTSFKEYVLLWQTIPYAQSWYKESEDLWRISRASGLEDELYLYSLESKISLESIYRRVKDLGEAKDFVAY